MTRGWTSLMLITFLLSYWGCSGDIEAGDSCDPGSNDAFCTSESEFFFCGSGETDPGTWIAGDCGEEFCAEVFLDSRQGVLCSLSPTELDKCPTPTSDQGYSSYCEDKMLTTCRYRYPTERVECEENEDCLASSDATGRCRAKDAPL